MPRLKWLLIAAVAIAVSAVPATSVNKAEASPTLILRLLVISGLRKKSARRLGQAATAARVARFGRAIDQLYGNNGFLTRLLKPVEAGPSEFREIRKNVELSLGHLRGQV